MCKINNAALALEICAYFYRGKWHSSSLNYVKNHSWNSTQTVTKHHTNKMAWAGSEYCRLCKQWQGKPLFLHHLVWIPGSSAHSWGKSIMHREIRFTPTLKKMHLLVEGIGGNAVVVQMQPRTPGRTVFDSFSPPVLQRETQTWWKRPYF